MLLIPIIMYEKPLMPDYIYSIGISGALQVLFSKEFLKRSDVKKTQAVCFRSACASVHAPMYFFKTYPILFLTFRSSHRHVPSRSQPVSPYGSHLRLL